MANDVMTTIWECGALLAGAVVRSAGRTRRRGQRPGGHSGVALSRLDGWRLQESGVWQEQAFSATRLSIPAGIVSVEYL